MQQSGRYNALKIMKFKKNITVKKKTHSVKNTIISDKKSNYVIYLGDTFEGKEHDKTILEAEEIRFTEKIEGYIDLAYSADIAHNCFAPPAD